MNECFYCGWVGRGGEKGGKERGQFNLLTYFELVFSRLGRWGGV